MNGQVNQILAFAVWPDGVERYFVTYHGKSYLHAKWITEDVMLASGLQGKNKLQRFLRKNPYPVDPSEMEDVFNQDFLEVDRIIAARLEDPTGTFRIY